MFFLTLWHLIHSLSLRRWKNSGKDLLTCDECKGSLCVKFHPDLSFESKAQLTKTYRSLLANSHKEICKHYIDAKRWLLTDDDSYDSDVRFVVPPFFLRLGIEFQLLQDQSKDGYQARNHLLSCAISLNNSMLKTDAVVDWSQYIDNDVKNLVFGQMKSVKVTPNSLVFLLSPQNKSTKENEDSPICDKLMEQSVFLVLFGWRSIDATPIIGNDPSVLNNNNGESLNENNGICIQCQLCLAKVVIYSDCPVNDRLSKRRRIEEVEGLTTSPPFHVLNSHRHYCPIVKGFAEHETAISGTSKPCWEVTLDKLLRRYKSSEGDDVTDQNCPSMDERFAFIRNTLRSSIKPKTAE
jgi:hypothetical protein